MFSTKSFELILLDKNSSSESLQEARSLVIDSPEGKLFFMTWDLIKDLLEPASGSPSLDDLTFDNFASIGELSSSQFTEKVLDYLAESNERNLPGCYYLLDVLYAYNIPIFIIDSSYLNSCLVMNTRLPYLIVNDSLSKIELGKIIKSSNVWIVDYLSSSHSENDKNIKIVKSLIGK